MDQDEWNRIETLYHELRDSSPAQCERRLTELEAEEPALVQRLRGLLAEAAQADLVFQQPLFPEISNRLRELKPSARPGIERDDGGMLAHDHGTPGATDKVDDFRDLADGQPDSGNRDSMKPPKTIGPYKVIKPIGAGGMGRVYLVEQDVPRRQVALKLIGDHHYSPAHLERFKIETQTLAVMSHNHIAQVFDAGTTEEGFPYFTMEHVPGRPVIGFCDENKLDMQARLGIFLQICEGVVHAHQRGAIHGDLKPSNIMVTFQNLRPIVKIIDFGIARITELDEGKWRMPIGTPAYMSPEQTRFNPRGFDTRSDIYSLGAVLYELLTGFTVLDGARLDSSPVQEKLRLVREEPLELPSHRLARAGAAAVEAVTRRGMSFPALRRDLRADLDWVVARALAKDPDQRYQSVPQLIADLEHFLARRPVSVAPRRPIYQFKKWIQRNTAGAFALGFALVAGILAVLYGADSYNRIVAEERITDGLQRVLADFLTSADSHFFGPDVKLIELLRDWQHKLPTMNLSAMVEAKVRAILGKALSGLGDYDSAQEHFERALVQFERDLGLRDPETIQLRFELAKCYSYKGRNGDAINLLRSTMQDLAALLTPTHTLYQQMQLELGSALFGQNKYPDAKAMYAEVRDFCEGKSQPEYRALFYSATLGIANVLLKGEDRGQAVELFRQIWEQQRTDYGVNYPTTLTTMHNLADALVEIGEYRDAEEMFKKEISLREVLYTQKHPVILSSQHSLARFYEKRSRFEEAGELYETVLQGRSEKIGEDNPKTLMTANNLGVVRKNQERFQEAEALFQRAVDGSGRAMVPDDDPDLLMFRANLGDLYIAIGKGDEALRILQSILRIRGRKGQLESQSGLIERCTFAQALIQEQELTHAELILADIYEHSLQNPEIGDEWKALFQGLYGYCLLKMGRKLEADCHLNQSMTYLSEKGSVFLNDTPEFKNELCRPAMR